MKTRLLFSLCVLPCWLLSSAALAQTNVTPQMGGGQVAADMVHIDIYYDAAANQLNARVDDSFGLPQLRPLELGLAFDPQAAFAVLTGKAYNAQYGWNVGGFFTIPAGAAIWIELIDSAPGLEVYEGWGKSGGYTPILGTAGSPRLWQWSSVMTHNTYAVLDPVTDHFFAEYRIYFGDANTGSREGFLDLDDAVVRLEWTAVPVEEPFRFGAIASTTNAPLSFLNADQFVSHSEFVVNLRYTNAGPYALQYAGSIPMIVVAATATHGGPVTNHAALGSCLELQLVSLAGPPSASLGFWEAGDTQPRFRLPIGELAGTNRFYVSESRGAPGADPYGCIPGRHFTVNQPGFYCLGFRLVDASTNGPGGGPIHEPSEVYRVYLQAGLTVTSLARQGESVTASFGGEPGKTFYLERATTLGLTAPWQTVAGPLTGASRLQMLTDSAAASAQGFYRLRVQAP